MLVAGPVIWLAHFLFIYAVNAIACARFSAGASWGALPVSSWIILASSALAVAFMAAIGLHQRRRVLARRVPAFHGRLTVALCLLSAAAVVWETLPVATTPACS